MPGKVANTKGAGKMAEKIIEITGLEKYYGPLHVLRGIDLIVRKGEVVVIIGASGSGKSTLIRCINALEQFSAGSIVLDGVRMLPDGEL